MIELLKKIGFPATIAAIVGALVTIIPIFFKLDERYAKEENLTRETARIEKQINELSIEVGKLAGSTQVLVSVIAAKSESPKLVPQPVVKLSPKSFDFENLPPSNAGSATPVASVSVPEVVTQEPKPVTASTKPTYDGGTTTPAAKLKDISSTLYGINQRVQQIQSK